MKKIIIVIGLFIGLCACGNGDREESNTPYGESFANGSDEAIAIIEPAEMVTIPTADFTFKPEVRPYGRPAHDRYRNDAVSFSTITLQGEGARQTAVIGSRVARFYPNAKLTTHRDLAGLGKGEPIPIAISSSFPLISPTIMTSGKRTAATG